MTLSRSFIGHVYRDVCVCISAFHTTKETMLLCADSHSKQLLMKLPQLISTIMQRLTLLKFCWSN